MFQNRLSELLAALGASSSDIAQYGGPDRTAVAHYKSGRRTPKARGAAAAKLTAGIYEYACATGKTAVLEKLTKIDTRLSHEEKQERILDWLYAEEGGNPGVMDPGSIGVTRTESYGESTIPGEAVHKRLLQDFGERFDKALGLAHLSNVSLSRLINVDASLISRYRRGTRIPRANSEIISTLGNTLWQYIVKAGDSEKLSGILKPENGDVNEIAFKKWLFEPVFSNISDISATEELLEVFDSYGAAKAASAEGLKAETGEDPIDETKQVYFGNTGLQEAVIRFLKTAADGKKHWIWLYSDQDMDWMTDERFVLKWAGLMKKCVMNGVHIRIIHNINRNLGEMTNAIRLWLPLYATGMIEPYYCPKAQDARFSHTLFICPGECCIQAANVSGIEAEGIYHYFAEKNCLDVYEREYEKLLEGAESLISFPDPGVYEGEECEQKEVRELQVKQFRNIRIRMAADYIEILPVSENWRPFRFSNPVMYRAFLAYEEYLGEGA